MWEATGLAYADLVERCRPRPRAPPREGSRVEPREGAAPSSSPAAAPAATRARASPSPALLRERGHRLRLDRQPRTASRRGACPEQRHPLLTPSRPASCGATGPGRTSPTSPSTCRPASARAPRCCAALRPRVVLRHGRLRRAARRARPPRCAARARGHPRADRGARPRQPPRRARWPGAIAVTLPRHARLLPGRPRWS